MSHDLFENIVAKGEVHPIVTVFSSGQSSAKLFTLWLEVSHSAFRIAKSCLDWLHVCLSLFWLCLTKIAYGSLDLQFFFSTIGVYQEQRSFDAERKTKPLSVYL